MAMPDPGPLASKRGISALNRSFTYGPIAALMVLTGVVMILVAAQRFGLSEAFQQPATGLVFSAGGLSHLAAGYFLARVPRERRKSLGFVGMALYLWSVYLAGAGIAWMLSAA
jgi:hypothetical protein